MRDSKAGSIRNLACLSRRESVAVAGEVTGVEGNFVTGPKSIPIRFEMS